MGGYLCLAINLKSNKNLHGEPFNFGPNLSREYSVLELVKKMSNHWGDVSWKLMQKSKKKFHESELLRLNCNKAKKILKWDIKDVRGSVGISILDDPTLKTSVCFFVPKKNRQF